MAKVCGSVVATQKNPHLVGKKLMLVRQSGPSGDCWGDEIIAVDSVGAGIGDIVLVLAEGGSIRDILKANALAPIESCIVGIVD